MENPVLLFCPVTPPFSVYDLSGATSYLQVNKPYLICLRASNKVAADVRILEASPDICSHIEKSSGDMLSNSEESPHLVPTEGGPVKKVQKLL